MPHDLLIRNGRVIDPETGFDEICDVAVKDGIIAAVVVGGTSLMGGKGKVVEDKNVPSQIFKPAEVPIPGFLFDHPDVRLELAHYYSSVRRADDCFAEIMKALDQSEQKENTVVMFLSDHGMPLPFAKTALWHHSTHTPLIISWPGVTRAGAV